MTYNPDWVPYRTEQELRDYAKLLGPNMDWSRRTGRTVCQLKKAYDAAADGERVFFIVPLSQMKNEAQYLVRAFFGERLSLKIVNVPANDRFEGSVRELTAGACPRQVFFDHYFWECLDKYYSRRFSEGT